jgi:hypothetical protein
LAIFDFGRSWSPGAELPRTLPAPASMILHRIDRTTWAVQHLSIRSRAAECMNGMTAGNEPLHPAFPSTPVAPVTKPAYYSLSCLRSVLPCSLIGTLDRDTSCTASVRASRTGDDSIASRYDRYLLRVGALRLYDHSSLSPIDPIFTTGECPARVRHRDSWRKDCFLADHLGVLSLTSNEQCTRLSLPEEMASGGIPSS